MNPLSLFNMPNWQAYCQKIIHLSTFKRQIDCLRLDLIHPIVSGNKPLKLLGWLECFQQSSYQGLLSFGGAYSNHLHALAFVGKELNIPVTLIVRAYADQPLTPTLQDCQHWGAKVIFADKQSYARRYEANYQAQLAREYQALVIGEGGEATEQHGALGEKGCLGLAEIAQHYDQVWLAVGSGTTALGLAKGLADRQASTKIVGVNAVADHGQQAQNWQRLMSPSVDWQLIDDAHLGGFAKTTPELLDLMAIYEQYQLPLEPVYSGKLLLAFEKSLPQLAAEKVLLIHGGGLQGRRGYASLFEPAMV